MKLSNKEIEEYMETFQYNSCFGETIFMLVAAIAIPLFQYNSCFGET